MKTDSFALRHLGPRDQDLPKMLETIGVESLDQLINETIPADIRLKTLWNWNIMTEYEFANHIRLGRTNKVYKSYIGLGYHPTVVPAAIQRNIFENPSWYTPYQAEIAQGRLEAILNFKLWLLS
jgi:glycine dehydrogenase